MNNAIWAMAAGLWIIIISVVISMIVDAYRSMKRRKTKYPFVVDSDVEDIEDDTRI